MKGKGTGSKSSPITIDDSEEEVFQELCDVHFVSSSPDDPTPRGGQSSRQKSAVSQDAASHTTQRLEVKALDHPRYPAPASQKRKRAHDEGYDEPLGDSHFRYPMSTLEARITNSESKKARKRRRKLERQAIEADARSNRQLRTNGVGRLLPEQMTSPAFQSWPMAGVGLAPPEPLPLPLSFSNDNRQLQDSRRNLPASPLYFAQPYPTYQQHGTKDLNSPTSAWVASMVTAGETAQPYHLPRPLPRPGPMLTDSAPRNAQFHSPSSARDLPYSTAKETLEPSKPFPLPTKPSAFQTIGMKPEQDPSSKHGLFQVHAASSISRPHDPSDSKSSSYMPNPARTLVMEQLPKTHRTIDFVNSWSKSACGAYPVYVSVHAPTAKALVEFATAELARKAWSSPKLGTAFTGLKPHQLKGRPREDLIKVWWYRVDGVGAGAGVGEIEEGEIEGDAGEKEVDVPKKETKKERKARLAKERQAKAKADRFSRMKASGNVTQQHGSPVSVNPLSSLPPQNASSTSRTPFPLPALPPPTYPNGNQHAGPSSDVHPFPFSQPYAQPYRHPQPPVAPPQHDAQWHNDGGMLRGRDRTFYGASERQKGRKGADDESIASSHHSIASSRSPSPVDLPVIREPITPVQGEIVHDFNSEEINDDDMDLDSPDNKYHPPLPLPLQTSVATAPSDSSPQFFALSAPVPKIGQHPIIRPPHPAAPIPTTAFSPSASPTFDSALASATSSQSSFLPISTTPPTSTSSPALSSTPPLAPSEPRAMKNPPKGPSYTKRSLLARHKELEEKIARSKMELEQSAGAGLLTRIGSPASAGSASASESIYGPNGDAGDKHVTEHRLRALVQESQKNKTKALVSPAPSAVKISDPSPQPTEPSSASSDVAVSSASETAAHGFSLDDLAVSFITETLQTLKATPQSAPASAPKSSSNTSTKLELAVRQKRLEQHIAESKILMAKLTQARTKQEKDQILTVMRERSRMMEEETQTSAPPTPTDNQHSSSQLKSQRSMRWPQSQQDAGVLIVSDDDDDSDKEDEVAV